MPQFEYTDIDQSQMTAEDWDQFTLWESFNMHDTPDTSVAIDLDTIDETNAIDIDTHDTIDEDIQEMFKLN